MRSAGKGFTLIELLIVIAIILILIAIALPNFLEAQIRAKVARVKSDQRTLTVALESYAVDRNGDYPPYRLWGTHGKPAYFNALTTPIKYLTDIDSVKDPFFDREIDDLGFDRYGWYSDGLIRGTRYRSDTTWVTIKTDFLRKTIQGYWSVRYCITSSGPDTILDMEEGRVYFYTPTNGARAKGDILRFGPFINQQ